MTTFVVGVAGGTGSGKTTVARKLVEEFQDQPVRLIPQDAYYKDLVGVPLEERVQVNYDHPLAFDNELLARHLDDLIAGQAVQQPIYNYHTHSRSEDTLRVEPATIILVEGILVLEDEKLRERMNIKVYVDTDADERFIRRLRRDLIERGRSIDSVIEQYLGSVRPMHLQFIEPTKRYADVIVPQGGANHVAIDLLASKIRAILAAIGG
jgi:uridine kinase